MKRKTYLVFGLLSLCLLCGVYLYSCFAPPTNIPCTPIEYPNGNKLDVESTKIYTFEAEAAYTDVVDFYRAHLKFDPPLQTKYETVEWVEHPIRDVGILFQCGSKLNGYELELGCIFVHEMRGKSVIDSTWPYGEVAATPCYVLPGIEPEDYLITP